uniref:Uncharacterized protein n=1 Tax=Rhizophora mucronata TaxID=61149 RepID=A0A2P2J212_RHIMU
MLLSTRIELHRTFEAQGNRV